MGESPWKFDSSRPHHLHTTLHKKLSLLGKRSLGSAYNFVRLCCNLTKNVDLLFNLSQKNTLAVVVMLLASLTACTLFEKKKEAQEDEVAKQFIGIAYNVHFQDMPPAVDAIVKRASILLRLQHRPPLTLTALDKRALKDMVEIEEALGIEGYFDAKVTFTLDTKSEEPTVNITVSAGDLYHFSSFDIEYIAGTPTPALNLQSLNLKIKVGDPVNLDKAQDMAKKIAKYYRTKGFPFARVLEFKGYIHRDKKKLGLIFRISLGPKATFGKTIVSGLSGLSETFVRNRLIWKEGETYNEEKVDESRTNLIESGLFNEVSLQPHDSRYITEEKHLEEREDKAIREENAPTDLHLNIKEGPARSVGGGLKYGTSDGWSGKVFWRHDNIRGGGQGFESKLEVGQKKKEARISYSIPDFLMRDQTLLTSLAGIEKKTRAFRSKTIEASGILSTDLTKDLAISYGLEGEIGTIKKNRVNRKVELVSTPVTVNYDSTENLLNPQSGFRVKGKTSPYFGHYEKNRGFWVNEIGASTYITPSGEFLETTDNAHVLALWAKAGHITAENLNVVPPTKRFYSGGGNSVRGYGYQLLGPLDNTRTPIGGRSITEFGGEYRLPINEKFGVAAFLEAGAVGLNNMPKLDNKNLLWGTGIGLRYYTGIGPIRFDFALPTKRRIDSDRRKKIDAPFQFYVSIGQAF